MKLFDWLLKRLEVNVLVEIMDNFYLLELKNIMLIKKHEYLKDKPLSLNKESLQSFIVAEFCYFLAVNTQYQSIKMKPEIKEFIEIHKSKHAFRELYKAMINYHYGVPNIDKALFNLCEKYILNVWQIQNFDPDPDKIDLELHFFFQKDILFMFEFANYFVQIHVRFNKIFEDLFKHIKWNIGDYKMSEKINNDEIKRNPNSPECYFNRAVTKVRYEFWSEALNDYNKAIELNYRYETAYLKRGELYLELKEFDKALYDFNYLIQLNPNLVEAYNKRGNVKIELQDIKGAIDDYNTAILKDNNNAQAYFLRGLSRIKISDLNGSICDLSKAIEIDSNNTEAYLLRGISKQGNKDINGAILDFTEVINYDYFVLDMLLDLRATAKYELGDYEGAMIDYKNAINLEPKNNIYHYQLGLIKAKLGDEKGACKEFKKAIELGNIEAAIELQKFSTEIQDDDNTILYK